MRRIIQEELRFCSRRGEEKEEEKSRKSSKTMAEFLLSVAQTWTTGKELTSHWAIKPLHSHIAGKGSVSNKMITLH